MAVSGDFWASLDRLILESRIVIDRPRHSPHPRFPEAIYPLDYGYLEGTTSMDGGGLDVWLGSLPERRLVGIAVTVDLKKRDVEAKLMLGCTPAEAEVALDFHQGRFMQAIYLPRGGDGLGWITSRRSVRRFLDRQVPREAIEAILRAAIQAPSAHNRQPWRFAILDTRSARVCLADAMGADFRRDLLADGQKPETVEAQVRRSWNRIVSAPAAILLCLQPDEMDEYADSPRQQAETLMAVQSVAMAGENLLLAAHVLGLGGVWICAPLFAQEAARNSLSLPHNWQPQGLVLLGYPQDVPDPRERKPLEAVRRYL